MRRKKTFGLGFFWSLGIAVALSGCTFTQETNPVLGPNQVLVRANDSVHSIAQTHNVSVRDLITTNQLSPPYALLKDQILLLPSRTGDENKMTREEGLRQGPRLLGPEQGMPFREESARERADKDELDRDMQGLGPIEGCLGTEDRKQDEEKKRLVWQSGPGVRPSEGGERFPPDGRCPPVQSERGPLDERARGEAVNPLLAEELNQYSYGRTPAKPAANRSAKTAPEQRKADSDACPRPEKPAPKNTAKKSGKSLTFVMPAEGEIVRSFSQEGGKRCNGVHIKLSPGSGVCSAAEGTVRYSGVELAPGLKGVVVDHDDGWITAYYPLEKIKVSKGAKIQKGQELGACSGNGKVVFELRLHKKPVNPLKHMN